MRRLLQTSAEYKLVRHKQKCGRCDLSCSSVQSLSCFSSAVALRPVISERKKKTIYNINKLQVGLNHQGTKVSL